MIFPMEIWIQIFSHSDPITLNKLRIVCKPWKETIDRTLQKNKQWLVYCEDYIPNDNWPLLIEKLNQTKAWLNFQEFDTESCVWYMMFKFWMKYKQLTRLGTSFTKRSFKPLKKYHSNEQITCAVMSENTLAISSMEGFIYLYNINDPSTIVDTLDHKEYITNMKVYIEGSKTLIASVSIHHHIKVWDLQKRQLLRQEHGALLCTSYNYCFTVNANELKVVGSSKKYRFDLYDFTSITANKNQVFLYSDSGYYIKLNVEKERDFSCGRVIRSQLRIRKYYTFMPELIACIAELGLLGFAVNGNNWIYHNVFPIFHAMPTAILIYLQLLFIGLDCGDVYICHVVDFETVDFECIEMQKIFSGRSAIVSMDIGVRDEGEFICIASDSQVDLLEF